MVGDTAGHKIRAESGPGPFVRNHQEYFLLERGGEVEVSLMLSPKVKAQGRGRASPRRFAGCCSQLQVSSREVGVSRDMKKGQEMPVQGSQPLHTFGFQSPGSDLESAHLLSVASGMQGLGSQRPHHCGQKASGCPDEGSVPNLPPLRFSKEGVHTPKTRADGT